MKNNFYVLFCSIFWLLPQISRAQTEFDALLFKEVKETPVYQLDSANKTLVFNMAYASAEIRNPDEILKIPEDYVPFQVDVVYSKYPKTLETWRIGYSKLLNERIRNVQSLDPLLLEQSIKWNFILQTNCEDEATAMKLNHFCVVHLRPDTAYKAILAQYAYPPAPIEPPTPPLISKLMSIDSALLRFNGTTMILDSVVLNVLERNPSWKNMLVVTDWTGSMYIYGAQVLMWHQMNWETHPDAVKHFVFFNDGDKTVDAEKEIGNTGGVYFAKSTELRDVLDAMYLVEQRGGGGDGPENNLEAIIKGMKLSDYDDIILIADNRYPPRDMALLPEINKPVKVLVCGGLRGKNGRINVHPAYVKIAYETKGSLHTLDEDISDLKRMKEMMD